MNGHTQWKRRKAGPTAHGLLALILILAPGLALAQTTPAEDPFSACMAATGGDGESCLDRLGGWYDWAPSATACRWVGDKVDAIIDAGGNGKWTDLFRNERCARLGLPHGPVAANAGVGAYRPSPYELCQLRGGSCDDFLGRHAYASDWDLFCPTYAKYLERSYDKGKIPLSLSDTFHNERCWRLGFTHFEPESRDKTEQR